MTIDDIEIKMKKCDPKKQEMIFNIIIQQAIEIRGFTARFRTTRDSTIPVWVINPPVVKTRGGKYFWVIKVTDSELWDKLKYRLQEYANNYSSR